MNKTQYLEYLQSPEWAAKRDAVLNRTDGRCEDCVRWKYANEFRRGRAEHVHHLTYERVGHERPEDLVGLCQYHHRIRHGIDEETNRENAKMNQKMLEPWTPGLSGPAPHDAISEVHRELGVTVTSSLPYHLKD
jgi:hypothetical protein